ncbi:iron chelate uptake ABC transporter family permease subunit [Micromonospora sp. MMS20-R2-23]|uniref:Iron chelate uptake ABC transporter family permease subunit n=2 Tax=Micromonospora antibiotica TaxID=2807623 RepID=A0ABS3V6Y7_9ACTN|nr:iron chelate uptake ABC transporter family permease subunit [Micromonospora antibiotica]
MADDIRSETHYREGVREVGGTSGDADPAGAASFDGSHVGRPLVAAASGEAGCLLMAQTTTRSVKITQERQSMLAPPPVTPPPTVARRPRRVVPVSLLLGAVFLILVDLLSRTLDRPNEMPIGIFTAVLGAPFFLWLLRSQSGAVR